MSSDAPPPSERPDSSASNPRASAGGFMGRARGRRITGGNPRKFRTIAVGIFALVTFGLMFFRGLASFYTDFLWFDQLGHGGLFFFLNIN